MDINQKFVIFCARKCLHLWNAPREVVEWLNNPQPQTANAVADAAWAAANATAGSEREAANATAWAAAHTTANAVADAAWAAWAAANATAGSERAALAAAGSERAALAAAKSCRISVNSLKQEFLSTWSNEDLSTTDPDWIEYATSEIFRRET